VLSTDPEITSIDVADITWKSVKVSWSVGQTIVINFTVVYYRATNATESWTAINLASQSRPTSQTVSTLEPGTAYQFYVLITSYGKNARSQTSTATTGKMQLPCTYSGF